jgi:endonuclease III-like uncharacterized protein
MENIPTAVLRANLLSVNGIGEETADSILCYGFSRTGFVIDAYTEKILRCTGIHKPRPSLKKSCSSMSFPATTGCTGKPMLILWNIQKSSV